MIKHVITGFLLALAAAGCTVNTAEPVDQTADESRKGKVGEFCGGHDEVVCKKGLYCKYEIEAMCGAADAGGTCAVVPSVCTKQYDPVCGCDEQTYGNACDAAANGMSVVSKGACGAPDDGAKEGEMCGGLAGVDCGIDLFCDYVLGTNCGSGGQSGVCKNGPDVCPLNVDPVCGCDGKTYGNACSARLHGVSVLYKGQCGDTQSQ
jgi:hypothetical protein